MNILHIYLINILLNANNELFKNSYKSDKI